MKVLNGTKSFPEHCAGKITLPSPNSTHFPLTHVILAGCVRAQIEIQIAWRVALSLRVKNDSDDDEDPLLN